ncbi:MAG TPA: GrdX family protein [Haloplasmataceae bacterium]
MKLIVTNNPLVYERHKGENIIYLENQDYLDVLIKARDLIHENYQLMVHPLYSNFLADKTFYKTIVLKEGSKIDLESIELIEDAIILIRNSLSHRDKRIYANNIKSDLQFIDYEIIKQAL